MSRHHQNDGNDLVYQIHLAQKIETTKGELPNLCCANFYFSLLFNQLVMGLIVSKIRMQCTFNPQKRVSLYLKV